MFMNPAEHDYIFFRISEDTVYHWSRSMSMAFASSDGFYYSVGYWDVIFTYKWRL
jgi:hypothetical protein